MEVNPYNPSATMLMALIFTTKHDYKNALKLVVDAAVDFPNHYGLLGKYFHFFIIQYLNHFSFETPP
jgi:hypothetical protein